MLLVKSRELRNSGNKSSYKSWAWCSLSPLLTTPFTASAETESLTNPASIVSIFLSLLLVVGIVFMLAFLMRRFNVTQSGSQQMKVVASMMAGAKERILVIEVGDEQHMVGITGHNINHLAKLERPLETPQQATGQNFKEKLTQALAGKMQASVSSNKGEQQ